MTSHTTAPSNELAESAWPPPPPTSKWPRITAYWIAAALRFLAGYQFVQDWQRIAELKPRQLHVWAEMPEDGGWRNDTLRVPSGRTVELTVHGVSGCIALRWTTPVSAATNLLGPAMRRLSPF